MSEFGKSPALPKGPVIIRWMRKDGTSVWAENSSTLFYDENGKVIAMQGISRDVTERVQAEQLYRTLTGSSPVGVYTVQDNKFVFTNPKIQKDTGYTEEELLGKDTLSIIHPEDRESARKNAREMLKGKRLQPYEYRYITKTGETRWALENVVSINYVGRQAVLGTPMDITERRQAEEALKTSIEALMASERRYRTLFESAAEGILIADIETKQFKYANPAICRMLGYSQEEFKEMALGDIHPKDSLKYVVSEFEAQAKGKKTLSEGIPCLRKDGKILYADIKTARALLDGTKCNVDFFADVSERRLAEEERRQNTEKLLKAMDATIKVLAMTVEIRDPYTAGHQQRVSSLATSIAQEMELPAEQIEGIRIAGVVHDIGKMNVPSEILSKPGRLNESEFDIIRMHPQASYDILKIVEFPWPIAQIVLQHHERMDGSGYPGHLSGKDIILEARVLAVADVVEAMASHRPYRPALGIDKAVEEISQKMGVLYDSEVVNACLKLFNEKRFKFDEEIQSAIWSPVKIG
jgi:PAS domain S-box-containing protein